MALVALLSFSSCRRAWFNGKLDGFWRIEEIEYTEDGSTVIPDNKFIMINLELLQLGSPRPSITGVISYSKSEKTLGVEFPMNPEANKLRGYGFMSNPATFDILKLDDDELILKSASSTVYCTRF